MTWADLLDDYAARIELLGRALDEGSAADVYAFEPPAEPLEPATDGERRRFDRLHARAGELQRRLVAARDATWSDIGETRRRAQAARAYGRR